MTLVLPTPSPMAPDALPPTGGSAEPVCMQSGRSRSLASW